MRALRGGQRDNSGGAILVPLENLARTRATWPGYQSIPGRSCVSSNASRAQTRHDEWRNRVASSLSNARHAWHARCTAHEHAESDLEWQFGLWAGANPGFVARGGRDGRAVVDLARQTGLFTRGLRAHQQKDGQGSKVGGHGEGIRVRA